MRFRALEPSQNSIRCRLREETAKKSWNSNQHSKTIWVISSTWAYTAAQWVWIFNFRKWRAISSDKTQKKRWDEMMIMRQRRLKDSHSVIGIFAIRIASSTRGFVDSRRIRQSVGRVLKACEFFTLVFVNSHDTFYFQLFSYFTFWLRLIVFRRKSRTTSSGMKWKLQQHTWRRMKVIRMWWPEASPSKSHVLFRLRSHVGWMSSRIRVGCVAATSAWKTSSQLPNACINKSGWRELFIILDPFYFLSTQNAKLSSA